MSYTITIDPVTRIEGHLSIQVEVESGKVSKAFSKGEMFRGFEMILKGRDPLDAQQITQRICGVCPVSHGTASILAQDNAYRISPPDNGRIIRNLILGANYIQSHIIHFYHLSALDFVDITAITRYQGNDPGLLSLKRWVELQLSSNMLHPVAPFLPRYDGEYIKNSELNIVAIKHYMEALEMRALAQKMGAVFGGKMPHVPALVPGGVTEKVTAHKIAAYKSMINELQVFIDNKYLPDIAEVARAFPGYFEIGRGCANFMSYGVFPENDTASKKLLSEGVWIDGSTASFDKAKITEDVQHSYYSSGSGLSPANGETVPLPHKTDAYSWIKSPRYAGKVVEVGPLSRVLITYLKEENADLKKTVDSLLSRLNRKPADLISVIGRHAARAIECKIVADRCSEWVEQLTPDKPAFTDFDIPENARGIGLTEAPRGSLGHWLDIQSHKIKSYQCVVPTTWNCSPRDDRGNPGPVEQALVATPISNTNHPIEAARVVRSFDPCIACAVH